MMSPVPRAHAGEDGAAAPDQADQVRLHLVLDFLHQHFLGRPADADAGAIHQDVDSSGLLHDPGYTVHDRAVVTHVQVQEGKRYAVGRAAPRGPEDSKAQAGKAPGACSADARGCTCHHDHRRIAHQFSPVGKYLQSAPSVKRLVRTCSAGAGPLCGAPGPHPRRRASSRFPSSANLGMSCSLWRSARSNDLPW